MDDALGVMATPIQKRKPRRWLRGALVAIVCASFVAGGVVLWPTLGLGSPPPPPVPRLPAGTHWHNLDLEAMTAADAAAAITRFGNSLRNVPVRLAAAGTEVVVSREELGWHADTGSLLAMLRSFGQATAGGTAGTALAGDLGRFVSVRLDASSVEDIVARHFHHLNVAAVPATVAFDGDEMTVVPEQNGSQPDAPALVTAIRSDPWRTAYDVPLTPVVPDMTAATLADSGLTGLAGSFTTYYHVSDTGRARNVELAAAAVDGLWLQPGESVSYNEIMNTVPDEAWQPATVIVNNRFVPGIGGGICQVSSTLYAAALVAGLEIVSRTNHSLPVFYMDPGFDATVASGGPDLKIRNNTSAPTVITAEAVDGRLTVRIFGQHVPGRAVVLTSEVVSARGPVADLYRTVKQDGVIVSTERVNRSVYQSGS